MVDKGKLIFICQEVGIINPINQSALAWANALRKTNSYDTVEIVCIRAQQQTDQELRIKPFESRLGRIGRLLKFYKLFFEIFLRNKVGTIDIFIYQGGLYALLLYPLRFMFRYRIFQWKAHPRVDILTRLQVKYINDLTFTSVKGALNIEHPGVSVVGQAVDLNYFYRLRDCNIDNTIVFVGRISRSKNIKFLIEAFAKLDLVNIDFHIYGDVFSEADRVYLAECVALSRELSLQDRIVFKKAIQWTELVQVLNGSLLMLNASVTAVDRACAEALCCGLPVVSTNSHFAEVLPNHYKNLFYLEHGDINAFSARCRSIITQVSRNSDIRKEISSNFSEKFDLNYIIKKISEKMRDV
jgi:glycosyltransferase involved in cell wall biosynthesis